MMKYEQLGNQIVSALTGVPCTGYMEEENMSDIIEYKCPACGGAMVFDSKSSTYEVSVL